MNASAQIAWVPRQVTQKSVCTKQSTGNTDRQTKVLLQMLRIYFKGRSVSSMMKDRPKLNK